MNHGGHEGPQKKDLWQNSRPRKQVVAHIVYAYHWISLDFLYGRIDRLLERNYTRRYQMNFGAKNFSQIVKSVILNRMHTVIAMVISMAIIGCRADDPSEAITKARSMFREVFREFKDQRKQYTEEYKEAKDTLLTFKEAMKTAQDKDAEFAKVYAKWKRVEAQVTQVHEKFANLVSRADALYVELENRANAITKDDQRKTKELHKINVSKENYTIRLKQSRNKIDLLDDINTKVRNTMISLEINYTLNVVEEKLAETFQEIDAMIESVMKELDELSRESELLLTKRFG